MQLKGVILKVFSRINEDAFGSCAALYQEGLRAVMMGRGEKDLSTVFKG